MSSKKREPETITLDLEEDEVLPEQQWLPSPRSGAGARRRELPAVGFLETLNRELRGKLRERGKRQRYPAGASIVEIGEPCAGLRIVLSGQISVERMDTFSWAPLTTLNAGDLLGALEWEEARTWEERIRAVGTLEVLFLSTAELQQLAASEPTLSERLIRHSEDHLLQTLLGDHEIFQQLPVSCRRRLASLGRRRRYRSGQLVFGPEMVFASLFILSTGSLELSRPERRLSRLQRGALAGLEIALGDGLFQLSARAGREGLELFTLPYEECAAALAEVGQFSALQQLAVAQRIQGLGEF